MKAQNNRSANPGRITITYRPIAELKLDRKNPGPTVRGRFSQIARSIEAFGFNVPCWLIAISR